MSKCSHGCGRDLAPGSKLPDCQVCRATPRYYKKKRPGQVVRRRKQLSVLTSRMDTYFNVEGKANVKPLPQEPVQKTASNVIEFRKRRRA